jgi:hypothetical protein
MTAYVNVMAAWYETLINAQFQDRAADNGSTGHDEKWAVSLC